MSPVFLYDGVCVLCSRAVRYVLRHEKRPDISFVAIQSARGKAMAVGFGIDPADPELLTFVEDGRALTKSDGILALLRHVGGPARLLLVGRWLPRRLRDRLYDLVARHRYRLFGRSRNCLLADASVRHRFLLPERP